MTDNFFSELPKTSNFLDIVDPEKFHPAPPGWVVVVADVKSSTKAVEEGRYKDVNMVGGCVICAALNAIDRKEIPFVFGGDGATLLIPASAEPDVKAALVRTRTLARADFGLELRIGFVPVEKIRKQGKDVLVARYEVSAGNNLAMFAGGGVELADRLVKDDVLAEQYAVPEYSLPGPPDLTGLSCRWEPLRSQNGSIICVLVKPQSDDATARREILTRVLAGLTRVLGTGLVRASPVTAGSMRFRWPPKGLRSEARATRGEKPFVLRYLEVLLGSLFQLVLERFDLRGGAYNAPVYREELRANSDYCRFDDVLRMVLDCTVPQIEGIRSLLETLHEAGEVYYGIFEVKQALMTCLLFSLDESQHLHFIDGDDGGFWAAAVQYKQQLLEDS